MSISYQSREICKFENSALDSRGVQTRPIVLVVAFSGPRPGFPPFFPPDTKFEPRKPGRTDAGMPCARHKASTCAPSGPDLAALPAAQGSTSSGKKKKSEIAANCGR